MPTRAPTEWGGYSAGRPASSGFLALHPSEPLASKKKSDDKIRAMNFSGRWFVGFGVFLVLCGLAGFLSNPSGAKTALISGGTFGVLSAAWGFLMLRGMGWAWMAALGCTGFLAAVFTWRAAVGWMAVEAGEPKLFAASLITLMLTGSLVSIGVLWKNRA
jgi:uncharacterized membrane protein (UPF0136 family)